VLKWEFPSENDLKVEPIRGGQHKRLLPLIWWSVPNVKSLDCRIVYASSADSITVGQLKKYKLDVYCRNKCCVNMAALLCVSVGGRDESCSLGCNGGRLRS